MGSLKLQKGWGIIIVVSMGMWLSSCAEKKKSAHGQATFDYFTEECVPGSRIVGGKTVRPYEADSNKSVLIVARNSDGSQSFCSSTLISDQVLLTAAHCVNEAVEMQAIFYSDVTCGSGYRKSQHAIPAETFVYHSGYKSNIKDLSPIDENPDLALVKLSRNAPNFYPIFKITETPETLTSNIFLYGFGVTGMENSDHNILRKTEIVREDLFFTNKAVFFDQKKQNGICSGDSGGAGLMLENNDLVVASVNSMVFAPEGDTTPDLCNVYSKSVIVHHYLPWIQNFMKQWNQTLK